MTHLLTVLAVGLGLAVIGLYIAWATAERHATHAGRERDQAEEQLRRYGLGEAEHFAGVPREQPLTLPADLPAQLDQFLSDLLRKER